MWLLSLIALLSFTSCGGGSSKEAKALLQKILQFVGIPQEMVGNICQDGNRDGICGGGELFTKVTINKGDTLDDIWKKISLTEDGRYFLETYNPELPILIELEDAKVNFDGGKFTLTFDGFTTKEDDNETKEVSILESMVDADALSKTEADKFRNLTNPKAQEKYYTELLNSLETNINTLREKGLDSKTAVEATIKEMGDETKANQQQADRINDCGSNQTCVDEEIKKISDELIIDENESAEITNQEDSQTPTSQPTSSPTQGSSKLKKTGQTTSYEQFDDGYYQIGIAPSYSRSGDIVTDNVTGLQWQDDEEVGQVEKTWEEAKSYCSALSVGGQSDWRLPTPKELMMIVDNSKFDSALDSTFVNVTSYRYWSSTSYASDSSYAWMVDFHNGQVNWPSKTAESSVRCVRGEVRE